MGKMSKIGISAIRSMSDRCEIKKKSKKNELSQENELSKMSEIN